MPITPTFYIDLSAFITESRTVISNTKTSIRSKRVSAFMRRVIDEGLSYDVQIKFWENELQRELREEFPSQDYIQENRENIVTNKQLKRAKYFRDTLAIKRNNIAKLKGNYEKLGEWLDAQLTSAIDDDLKVEIRTAITENNKTIYDNIKIEIDDLIERGKSDKSLDILKEADEKIDIQLARASGSDNADEVEYWKLKKSWVKQDRNGIRAENAINDFKIGSLRGDSAESLLNTINDSIKGIKDDTTAIFVDGIKYEGIFEYLDTERQAYINDESPTGFLGKIRAENSKFLETVISKVGMVPDTTIDQFIAGFDRLKGRQELSQIANKLDNVLYDADGLITKAIENNANEITSRFLVTLDFQKAAKELARLSQKYKIDTGIMADAILVKSSDYRASLLDHIMGIAESLYQGTAANPSTLTWAEAVKQATEGYVGGIVSPSELMTKSVQDIALDAERKGPEQVRATPEALPTGSDVDIPVGQAPVAGPDDSAAGSTPNVPGSAGFENSLDVMGDTAKRQTMAGWGYKWEWTDRSNGIGGWIPVSNNAKAKFKQKYGVTFTGKKATLFKGDKRVVVFAEGKYSRGLLQRGYALYTAPAPPTPPAPPSTPPPSGGGSSSGGGGGSGGSGGGGGTPPPAPPPPWQAPAGALHIPNPTELAKFGNRQGYVIADPGGPKKYVYGNKVQYISSPAGLAGLSENQLFRGPQGRIYKIL